jgi:hypothetical protein
MLLPKGYCSAGDTLINKIKTPFFTSTGIVGAIIILLGFTQDNAQLYYVCGSTLLLLTAIFFNSTYFMALELILLAGHGAMLLGIGPIIQVVLPILLCLQLLVYYYLSDQLGNVFRIIGIVGIALLSIGFSYPYTGLFFVGSLCIALYAFYNVYNGKPIALIWAILNLFFAFATARL